MKCPECGSSGGMHRLGCREGARQRAVSGIARFWEPLGWIGRLFAAAMYLGVLLFFGEVLYVVGRHSFDMALILAVGGLAIIVVMSGYIRVCFQEGRRFFYSRVGALWAVVTAVLWGVWYLVYQVALQMKPGGEHPILAFFGRAALMAPILLCFFLLFVGGGIAIFVVVRRALKPEPDHSKDSEPYLAQELPGPWKAALTGFVAIVGLLLGSAALQGAKDVLSGIGGRTAPTQGNVTPLVSERPADARTQLNSGVSPESSTCNVGKYTADSGTLHLSAPEINQRTGEIIVNGMDSARPITPFRFIWGDGTVTIGWFPQKKIYKKRPYSRDTNCYQVWVVATHSDGSTAEVARAVNP